MLIGAPGRSAQGLSHSRFDPSGGSARSLRAGSCSRMRQSIFAPERYSKPPMHRSGSELEFLSPQPANTRLPR